MFSSTGISILICGTVFIGVVLNGVETLSTGTVSGSLIRPQAGRDIFNLFADFYNRRNNRKALLTVLESVKKPELSKRFGNASPFASRRWGGGLGRKL